jgi:hypothetical protein
VHAEEHKAIAAAAQAELERHRTKTYEEVPKLDHVYINKELTESGNNKQPAISAAVRFLASQNSRSPCAGVMDMRVQQLVSDGHALASAQLIAQLEAEADKAKALSAKAEVAARDVMSVMLVTVNELLTALVPGWKAPDLKHPHAKPFTSALEMRYHPLDKIVTGDQIMVMLPGGYFHHGVYVGMQHVGVGEQPAVVDFWGLDKDRASIGLRSLTDFTNGAIGFAKAAYPEGAAVDAELSARVALAWAAHKQKAVYNVALKNCEVFATICRCGRCAAENHRALCLQLAEMPPAAPARRGFK